MLKPCNGVTIKGSNLHVVRPIPFAQSSSLYKIQERREEYESREQQPRRGKGSLLPGLTVSMTNNRSMGPHFYQVFIIYIYILYTNIIKKAISPPDACYIAQCLSFVCSSTRHPVTLYTVASLASNEKAVHARHYCYSGW